MNRNILWQLLASTKDDEASLADLKASFMGEKAESDNFLAASEEKLAYAERRVQEPEHNKATLDSLATRIDGVEVELKSSEEQVHLLEDKCSE